MLFAGWRQHIRFASGFAYAPFNAMVTKTSKWSRIQDSCPITPKIEPLVAYAMPDISSKLQKDPSITFWVILLTNKQTNRRTKTGKNITFLAEVITHFEIDVQSWVTGLDGAVSMNMARTFWTTATVKYFQRTWLESRTWTTAGIGCVIWFACEMINCYIYQCALKAASIDCMWRLFWRAQLTLKLGYGYFRFLFYHLLFDNFWHLPICCTYA